MRWPKERVSERKGRGSEIIQNVAQSRKEINKAGKKPRHGEQSEKA